MKERTVLLGGFSKAYAMTGWRVGWVCAPADILEAMMKIHQYIVMSAPTPSQYAALEAITNGEEYTRQFVAEFDARRRLILTGLRGMGLTTFEPKGAFYAFPSIHSTGMTDMEFAEALLNDEKVAVIPGSAFGECGRGHVRMCYASPRPLLEEALERIARFVQRVS
jgi:aminotransferase